MFRAVSCNKFQCPCKKTADETDRQSGQDCEKQPLDQICHVILDVPGVIVQIVSFFRIFIILCVVHKLPQKLNSVLHIPEVFLFISRHATNGSGKYSAEPSDDCTYKSVWFGITPE